MIHSDQGEEDKKTNISNRRKKSHFKAASRANTPIDDLSRLRRRVRTAFDRVRDRPALGRGFLKYTGLF